MFWAFMDLGNAYDTIDRHGLWQMLRVYGVGGKLLSNAEYSCRIVDGRAVCQVFYGQESPSGESTTTKCGVSYQLLAVIN